MPEDKILIHHHKALGHLARESIVDIMKFSISRMVRIRLPWLLLGLLGGIVATLIVRFFEGALEQKLALAFFIPVIVYMSDAVGTQTETLFIRALAIEKIAFKKYLLKEIVIGFLLGAVLSVLLYLYAALVFDDALVAMIVGISMVLSSTFAVIIATFVPLILRGFGVDPAVGAGPFTTVVQDILALVIYFLVASFMLV